ncbi:enoyl-CoA hydratase/isomerase family protein [Actinomadura rugatobispora]|uniref:Enoyl-CoA hydratase/isomerase family protein n=1 Tax=Actinomadura rugatobispora TaxID=1994 RepID=A0ABW1A7K5_9ACTN|nr:enoyl-CoA hydratase/isomerase family protein [Actinomadura rugatobispora]
MAEQWLHGEVAGGVATITIDRPEKRNAMTTAMWHRLPELLEVFADDPAVRVVVLTGAGGNFCAGADIGELAEIRRRGDAHPSTVAEDALAAFPKPTVAAIEGFCVGGGCQLATACDLRFAAADARFGITPARLGIVYPASATRRLVRQVGASAAKYLLYSADLVPAEHALRIGLLNEVVDPGDLHRRVTEFAATLASRSLLTQRATKEIVDTIVTGADLESTTARWLAEAHAPTGDMTEGVTAFEQRRPPTFTWTTPHH